MKKLLLFLLGSLAYGQMVSQQLLIAEVNASSGSVPIGHIISTTAADVASSVTSSAIDDTAANIDYVFCVTQTPGTCTVTDSKSNTYAGGTQSSGTNVISRLFCVKGTTGSGHTFTGTSTAGSFITIFVATFSGVNSCTIDQHSENQTSSGTTVNAGSGAITPTQISELLIAATGGYNAGLDSYAVDSSFTLDQKVVSAGTYGGVFAYQIQTSIVARNPQFTVADGATFGNSALISSFKATAP